MDAVTLDLIRVLAVVGIAYLAWRFIRTFSQPEVRYSVTESIVETDDDITLFELGDKYVVMHPNSSVFAIYVEIANPELKRLPLYERLTVGYKDALIVDFVVYAQGDDDKPKLYARGTYRCAPEAQQTVREANLNLVRDSLLSD